MNVSENVVPALLLTAVAGLSTGIGSAIAYFIRKPKVIYLSVSLGFSAGVMLAATAFSLIVPSIDLSSPWVAALGITMGAGALHLIDRFIPHFHPALGLEGPPSRLSRVWLLIIAITIHNFPEGLAVGVAFGSASQTGDITTGAIIALAIGLQNIPEGTAVALPLLREGYKKKETLAITTFTGLVEPIGGFIGVAAVSIALGMLGFGMAFAAGAMIFVVSDEIIPESHRKGHERAATFGVILGFMVMMFLDNFIAGA